MIQNGEGIRVTQAVPSGGSVTVNVGPNDSTVEINVAGTSEVQVVDVPPNKDAVIPVPPVPPGTILFITVGKGLRARVLIVEVIALAPQGP